MANSCKSHTGTTLVEAVRTSILQVNRVSRALMTMRKGEELDVRGSAPARAAYAAYR